MQSYTCTLPYYSGSDKPSRAVEDVEKRKERRRQKKEDKEKRREEKRRMKSMLSVNIVSGEALIQRNKSK